jgi:hypothetical protein
MEKELLKIKTSNIQYFVGIGNLIHKFKTIQRSFLRRIQIKQWFREVKLSLDIWKLLKEKLENPHKFQYTGLMQMVIKAECFI